MTAPYEPFLHGELFADSAMRETVSDLGLLSAMLDFETALAEAEAATGVIPEAAAQAIRAACDPAAFDRTELARRVTLAGNPAIPLVAMLTAKVAASDAAAADFVHFGATSQDVIDSAWGIVAGSAVALVDARLAGVATALAEFADRHRATPMAGRTLLQQALPVSFGLVAANWLESVLDARAALARHDLPWLQFGGATGTLAALGDKALVVAQKLARTPPFAGGNGGFPRPWHTNRTRVIRLAGDLGLAVAALGKIARDVTLLMQTEVAELVEPEALGKGGSSTLPHKRNPVQSLAILAAAARAPGLVATLLHASVQEHQRGTGGWHAEWETLRDLLLVAGAATFHAEAMLAGLDVKAGRMRANLEATGGLIMAERLAFALSPGLGKTRAKQVMEAACRRAVDEGRHLREVLAATPECLGLDLEALLDPSTYLGAGEALIDRILDSHRRAIPPANGDKS